MQHGFKKETLIKTGLSIEYEYGTIDRFRGRVIYPVHTISGKIVAFGGRVLNKTDKAAKYVNSPESEIYHKSDQLYGIYQAKGEIVRQDMCYLVEGYMDVISMHQFGIKNVVASSGTSLTTGQIRMIHRFTENVTVMYDGDAAGIHASIRGIDMLLSEGLNIKVVSLPEGEDPDSYAQTHNSDETISYIKEHAVDFIRFKTLLFMKEAGEDPIKRAELIADIIKSISVIPNNIKRSVYVRECSRLMEIDENTLFSEIDKILRGQAAPSRIITRNPNEKNGNQNISQNPSLRTAEANADRSRPVSAEKEVTNPFFREEADLLRFVIKNGAVQIFTDYEGNWLTVTEYIKLTYIEENLEIHTDSFRKTMDAAEQYCSQKENQIALSDVFLKETLANKDEEARFYEEAEKKMEDLSRFLFNHTDPIVSQTAIKLGIDRYYMCRTQREQYGHDYIRFKNTLLTLLNAIRKKFIETEIIKLKSLLAVATQEKNEQRISEIFQQLQELNTIKVKLNN